MATTASPRQRLEPVDLLRGVIIVIMALDHTRDYFGVIGADPTNLDTTTPGLFFTRWVTHFCAPVFFLLTGTGAFLALRRRTPADLSRFLFTRGLWLLFVEAVILRTLMQFNVDYHVTILTVLWALGWAMIALAFLSRLPLPAIITFGVALVLGHNALDGISAADFGSWGWAWTFLHAPGFLWRGTDHLVLVAYPVIPWIGVTALGFALGAVYAWAPGRRVSFLLRLGTALTFAFVAVRLANVYGDPRPWSYQASTGWTLISFLDVTKYPPSLQFLLMTLGPALLALGLFERGTPKLLGPALTIGKVPFFFFLGHFFLIHLFALLVSAVRYGAVHWMFESPSLDRFPVTAPPGWGYPLPVVYLAWITVVLTMYPLCRWYAALRARRTDPWLSYL
jgi:uncharacterized membrane protein